MTLRPVVPMRHGRPDTRPRKSARRDYELLTRAEAKAIMGEFYRQTGQRWERVVMLDAERERRGR